MWKNFSIVDKIILYRESKRGNGTRYIFHIHIFLQIEIFKIKSLSLKHTLLS